MSGTVRGTTIGTTERLLPPGVLLYRLLPGGGIVLADREGSRELAPEGQDFLRFIDEGQFAHYLVGDAATSPERPSNATVSAVPQAGRPDLRRGAAAARRGRRPDPPGADVAGARLEPPARRGAARPAPRRRDPGRRTRGAARRPRAPARGRDRLPHVARRLPPRGAAVICPHCAARLQRHERTGGTCARCRRRFALDPRRHRAPACTTPASAGGWRRRVTPGRLRVTLTQLWHACRVAHVSWPGDPGARDPGGPPLGGGGAPRRAAARRGGRRRLGRGPVRRRRRGAARPDPRDGPAVPARPPRRLLDPARGARLPAPHAGRLGPGVRRTPGRRHRRRPPPAAPGAGPRRHRPSRSGDRVRGPVHRGVPRRQRSAAPPCGPPSSTPRRRTALRPAPRWTSPVPPSPAPWTPWAGCRPVCRWSSCTTRTPRAPCWPPLLRAACPDRAVVDGGLPVAEVRRRRRAVRLTDRHPGDTRWLRAAAASPRATRSGWPRASGALAAVPPAAVETAVARAGTAGPGPPRAPPRLPAPGRADGFPHLAPPMTGAPPPPAGPGPGATRGGRPDREPRERSRPDDVPVRQGRNERRMTPRRTGICGPGARLLDRAVTVAATRPRLPEGLRFTERQLYLRDLPRPQPRRVRPADRAPRLTGRRDALHVPRPPLRLAAFTRALDARGRDTVPGLLPPPPTGRRPPRPPGTRRNRTCTPTACPASSCARTLPSPACCSPTTCTWKPRAPCCPRPTPWRPTRGWRGPGPCGRRDRPRPARREPSRHRPHRAHTGGLRAPAGSSASSRSASCPAMRRPSACPADAVRPPRDRTADPPRCDRPSPRGWRRARFAEVAAVPPARLLRGVLRLTLRSPARPARRRGGTCAPCAAAASSPGPTHERARRRTNRPAGARAAPQRRVPPRARPSPPEHGPAPRRRTPAPSTRRPQRDEPPRTGAGSTPRTSRP